MIQLRIKVKPNSFKDEITFDPEGNIVIKIKEKPIDGAANKYLLKYLAKELNCGVSLEKGQSSQFKTLTLSIPKEELETVLNKYR